MKNTIHETHFGIKFGMAKQTEKALRWIKSNKFDDEQRIYNLLIDRINPVIQSPLSSVFEFVKHNKQHENNLTMSFIRNDVSGVPEIIASKDIYVNGAEVKGAKGEYSKPWLNITEMVKLPNNNRNDELTISSRMMVINLVSRNAICSAYDNNTAWVNPTSGMFLMDVYATLMHSIVNRPFNLNSSEGSIVLFAFAWYYATMLNEDIDSATGAPALMTRSRHNYLVSSNSEAYKELAIKMTDIIGNNKMSLEHVIEFIKETGPSRLSKLNVALIYRTLATSSVNAVQTWIAADYPPYMAMLILQTLSGIRHPLLHSILTKQMRINKVRESLDVMVKTKTFYNTDNK
jgi:hypothetical protein